MKLLYVVSFMLCSFLHFSFQSQAILDPIDFFALQSIRKSLSDLPSSTFFSTWDFTSDPCNFSGVFCDGARIVALNLGDPSAASPGLSGRLDPALGRLSALSELTLVPGRVMGALPQTLGNLGNLRFLGISQNFISGEIPGNLAGLVRLRTLDLSYNQLTGAIPAAVGALPELTNVVLGHNHLSGSIPCFISRTLTRIDLKHNNLTGSISPVHFPPSLQYLSLHWNRFEAPVDQLLTRLINLNYLDLSSNRFTGLIPGAIFSFPISHLDLNRNLFSGTIQPFDQVKISTVDLSYNRFYGEVSPMLSTVQNLYLNNNRFTGSVPGTLVDRLLSASIQTLYLQHNFLTGIQINPTAEIPVSSSLCLQYNCMVPPVQTPCPLKAGTEKVRPTSQCVQWRGYPVPQRADTQGRSEEYVGRWMRQRRVPRDRVVLATKVTGPSGQMTWIRGGPHCLDAKNISEAIDGSLTRLRTDHIDLFQIHWPDRYIPMFGETEYDPARQFSSISIEEQLEALSRAVDAGKIRYLGLSNETPYGLMKFLHVAARCSLHSSIISLQNSYSLLCRNFDFALAECCHHERISLLAYSPLAMGILSGKYFSKDGGPSDARMNLFKGRYSEGESRYNLSRPILREAAKAYQGIAEKYGLGSVSLAIAFVLRHPLVASAIFGATKLWQLQEVIDACHVDLNSEILSDINKVHSTFLNPCP